MKEYDQRCKTFEAFTEELKKLIDNLLKESGIRVLSVESRTKNIESLKKTLAKKEKKVAVLNDIPDISGLRIITFFADDVDSVADIIETEFDIDQENSVDKRLMLDPDRFGYLSLHYVVRLSASRLKLTEYRRFKNCHAEVQIRSVLQHAWDEIEHDLGYKSELAVPREVRRRFSRLAGLLETADDEFMRIRDELSEYEEKVPERIARAPEFVTIDAASLSSFIETSTLLQEVDTKILSIVALKGSGVEANLEILLYELHFNGITTISGLDSALRTEQKTLPKFAELLYPDEPIVPVIGISVIVLCLFLVGKTRSLPIAKSFLEHMPGIPFPKDIIQSRAEQIISGYERVAGC